MKGSNGNNSNNDIRKLSEALYDTIKFVRAIVEHLNMTALENDEDIDTALDTARDLMNRR